jgi:hypothetical protein
MHPLSHHPSILPPPPLPRHLTGQSPPGESPLPPRPDLLHPLHRLERGRHQIPIILEGNIASLGELAEQDILIDDHLLAAEGAVGLGPLQLAGLPLHLEVLVAFGAAEAEGARIVAHKGDAFRWVDGTRAEVTGFDSEVKREFMLACGRFDCCPSVGWGFTSCLRVCWCQRDGDGRDNRYNCPKK